MEKQFDKFLFHGKQRNTIEQLNEEQLYWLNELIVDRLKYLQRLRDLEEVSKFRRGQKIQWEYQGVLHKGSIIKVNQKTITAHEAEPPYRKWKLGPDVITVI